MQQPELLPHLFRTEFSRIAAVLCKSFGIAHIEVAEDIAAETFLAALESWQFSGVPPNPTAWLYAVARNKAATYFQRDRTFSGKILGELKQQFSGAEEIDLSEENITDSQLQMLFAICHPSIPTEAQIGLALRILCGFGIDEIADAFLNSRETINKRLYRAREKLRAEQVVIAMPSGKEIDLRLEAVLTTLYLLFNEGYYSSVQDAVLRKDLCLEAMRLTLLLTEHEATNLPRVNALLALMCFQASRFEARKNEKGEIVLYEDQDESLWNEELISRGAYYLHRASGGDAAGKYHLEASIAYWHTLKKDTPEKWQNILKLYNQLLVREYSPIVALNRNYVLSKVKGKAEAIREAEKLNLQDNHFYSTLLGELYKEIDQEKAGFHFKKALQLARSKADKQLIQQKLDALQLATKTGLDP